MSRTMYDSVTAADIPMNAQMVAGYISGPYAWSAADWARFPNAVKVTIATEANVNNGIVLDIEAGDATPGQAPGWVQMRRAAGVDPSVYMSESQWQTVKNAFTSAGVPEPHYWVAAYDNIAAIPLGAVAKQYANAPLAGGHYDLSIVADNWPGVDEGDDVVIGEAQGLASMNSMLNLGRLRTTDDADAQAIVADPNQLNNVFSNTAQSEEAQNRVAGLTWLVNNVTDGQGNIVPSKLAAALGLGGQTTIGDVESDIAKKLGG